MGSGKGFIWLQSGGVCNLELVRVKVFSLKEIGSLGFCVPRMVEVRSFTGLWVEMDKSLKDQRIRKCKVANS